MDLRLVAYFVAVVDHRGITKAAEALYIAQPSLSQAIRTLERELGVELFDRSGRTVTLTEHGRAFLPIARQIMQDVDTARTRVHHVRDAKSGRLDIASLTSLAVTPLAELTARLRTRHRGIVVTILDSGGAAAVVADVRSGRAEIGFTDLRIDTRNLVSHELEEQEIALALPEDAAADLPDPVPLRALTELPLIMEPRDHMMHMIIDEIGKEAIESVVIECAHRPAIWKLVRLGAGATLVPRSLGRRELGGVTLRSTEPALRRRIGLIHRPGPLSPAARVFLDVVGVTPSPAAPPD